MTGDPPPPTQRTPEELIARLVAGFMAYVSALIDATLLPRACRKRLKATFAALFARFEARCLAVIEAQRAENALNQPDPATKAAPTAKPREQSRRQRTKTTQMPSTPAPASAPIAESPIAAAPPQKRVPAPNHPTRAPSAVALATIFTLPNPRNFQKAAFTTPFSHAPIITISQQNGVYHPLTPAPPSAIDRLTKN